MNKMYIFKSSYTKLATDDKSLAKIFYEMDERNSFSRFNNESLLSAVYKIVQNSRKLLEKSKFSNDLNRGINFLKDCELGDLFPENLLTGFIINYYKDNEQHTWKWTEGRKF